MSFTASFTSATPASGSLAITDTSNYGGAEPKNTFTNRQLFVTYANGEPFSFPSYPDFSFASYPSDILTLAGMTRDFSLLISLVLTSAAPQPGSIYTATKVITLTNFSYLFLYSLSQAIAANPNVTNIPGYFANVSKAYALLNMAKNAGFYSDQVSAQAALNQLNTMIQNQNILFG
jgi:hypothetical protein